jgi:hypothetical protein
MAAPAELPQVSWMPHIFLIMPHLQYFYQLQFINRLQNEMQTQRASTSQDVEVARPKARRLSDLQSMANNTGGSSALDSLLLLQPRAASPPPPPPAAVADAAAEEGMDNSLGAAFASWVQSKMANQRNRVNKVMVPRDRYSQLCVLATLTAAGEPPPKELPGKIGRDLGHLR